MQRDLENDRQILSLVARLLSHYFTGEMSAEARRLQALDWLEDLREFGPEIVSEACGRYRKTVEDKKPTPAAIRRFCIEAETERKEANAPRMLPSPEAIAERDAQNHRRDVEMQLEGRAISTEWARKRGYEDIDAYAEAQGISGIVARKQCAMSILAARSTVVSSRERREPQFSADALAIGRAELGLEVRETTQEQTP